MVIMMKRRIKHSERQKSLLLIFLMLSTFLMPFLISNSAVAGEYDFWHSFDEAYSDDWTNPDEAIDGNLGTEAYVMNQVSYLTVNKSRAVLSDRIKIYCWDLWLVDMGNPLDANVSIDVYYNSSWNNIHDGILTGGKQYHEILIGSTEIVNKTRVKSNSAYFDNISSYITTRVNDVQIYGSLQGNAAPALSSPGTANESVSTLLSFTWNITIEDPEGDAFDWTIQCSDGQNSSGLSDANGSKNLSLTDLDFGTQYFIWVNATDEYNMSVSEWFTFNVTDYPVGSFSNFLAVSINHSAIDITWSALAGSDSYYIEYVPDNLPSSWYIGDQTGLVNDTNLSYDHRSLNPSRRYYYKGWGYNATYNVYSLAGVITSAQTDIFEGYITLGDNPTNFVPVTDDEWSEILYYKEWQDALKIWRNTAWNSAQRSEYSEVQMLDIMRAEFARDRSFAPFDYGYFPFSWWNQWINNGHLMDGQPFRSINRFDDEGTKQGAYCLHRMDNNVGNLISMNYDKGIRGAITGFGLYLPDTEDIQIAYSRDSFDFALPPSSISLPLDEPSYFWDNLEGNSPFTYRMYDIYESTVDYSKIKLSINGELVNVIPTNGGDGEWYRQNKYLYWDLALNDATVFANDEPLIISVYFEEKAKAPTKSGQKYFVYTTNTDIDGDGYLGFRFASGSAALTYFNDGIYSGIEDTNREINYFLEYDPNIGSPIMPDEPGSMVSDDRLFIKPASTGMYEIVNIIYFLNNTLYPTTLNIKNASGGVVYSKTLRVSHGNVFYTPLESGVYTVNLTRLSIQTTFDTFHVYSQKLHGWIAADANPVLKNNMFNIFVFYDIEDYPAVLQLYDENMVLLKQWGLPANKTIPYDLTHKMTTSGKHYLYLSQQRPYDTQVIATYILWVKDREYIPEISVDKVTPRIGETVTISVTQNIVGTADLIVKTFSQSQNRIIKIDNIGEKYVFSYTWTPDKFLGYHDLRMMLEIPYVGTFYLANTSIQVREKLVTEEDTDVDPVVNLPDIISIGGGLIGLDDIMFRTILGAIVVIIVMLIPLFLAAKFKLKFADRILTNPMVYSMTAILGAVISFALGLFELWIFVLIFIVAITFFIKTWRAKEAAGD